MIPLANMSDAMSSLAYDHPGLVVALVLTVVWGGSAALTVFLLWNHERRGGEFQHYQLPDLSALYAVALIFGPVGTICILCYTCFF